MKLRIFSLFIIFIIFQCIKTKHIEEIRWVPNRWCGTHPPYTGTLFTGISYGLPLTWIEIGHYEKCTTVTSIIPDFELRLIGLLFNILSFIAIGFVFSRISLLKETEI